VGEENAIETEVFAVPLLSAVFFYTKLIAAEAGTAQHSRVNAKDKYRVINDKRPTKETSSNIRCKQLWMAHRGKLAQGGISHFR